MKPRILFIVQLPPPVHGVTVMNSYTIDNPWWNKNYEVKTLPLQFGQTLTDIGKITFVKVLHMIRFIFRLGYVLLSFRPALVYFTIMPTGKIFYRDALLTSFIKLFGPKIIFHLHRKGIKEMAKQSNYKRWLYKRTFRGVETICLSEKLTDDIRSVYTPRPYILANGISVVNNHTGKPNNEVPKIIFLSNLIKSKGIEVFLHSLVDLIKQGYRFTARIIGASVDYTIEQAREFCLQEGIADVVEVVGPKFGDEKFDELKKADIFVLPSFNECVPLSILEAMQFGLPVVATNVGGIPDIITDGTNGLLVSPGNVKELSSRLKKLLSDEALRMHIGNNARQHFIQKYTLSNFYNGLDNIFEKVLNGKLQARERER